MTARDTLSGIIVGGMIKKGYLDLRTMRKNTVNARKKNENLLFKILDANRDTEYGRRYRFDEIKTTEDFRRMVPLTDYPDYEDYIARMIGGEENILTALPLVGYAQSSGSSGKRKLIPLTQPEIDIYTKYTVTRMLAAADAYSRKTKRRAPKPFRGFFICQSYDEVLPNGLTCSNAPDIAAKQLGKLYPYILNTPFRRLFNKNEADFRYVNTRFALQDRDTMYIYTIFIRAFCDVMAYLKQNWRTMVDDIEKGTVSGLAGADPETKRLLQKMVKPDPERAAELRREFEKGFDETICRRIWPNLSVIGGIGTATFSPFANIARRYMKDIPMDFSIYGASEGMFAAVDRVESTEFVPLIDSCYYEFIPLDDESRVLSLDELETGSLYEIVITNQAGLYRYRCGDVIKAEGRLNDCPTVSFAFRKGQLLNVSGEKTTEEHMTEVIRAVEEASGCVITDWCTYVDLNESPFSYALLLENDEGRDLRVYSDAAGRALQEINVRYRFVLDSGTLGRIRIRNLKSGTQKEWEELQVSRGTPVTTVKPVRMIDTVEKEQFFLSRVLV